MTKPSLTAFRHLTEFSQLSRMTLTPCPRAALDAVEPSRVRAETHNGRSRSHRRLVVVESTSTDVKICVDWKHDFTECRRKFGEELGRCLAIRQVRERLSAAEANSEESSMGPRCHTESTQVGTAVGQWPFLVCGVVDPCDAFEVTSQGK